MGLVLSARRTIRRPPGAPAAPHGEAGFSLLEGLFSATILLFLAIGILPLFTTARIANTDGHDSSVASYEARSWVDSLLTRTLDDASFDLLAPPPGYTVRAATSGAGGEELVIPPQVWDTGATTPAARFPHLGDAGWVDTPSTRGLVLWRRQGVVRDYSYADIADGVIDTTTGDTLATVGHPDLFDGPLSRGDAASLRQFKETDLHLVSQRGGGEVLGRGGLRTHFLRTF